MLYNYYIYKDIWDISQDIDIKNMSMSQCPCLSWVTLWVLRHVSSSALTSIYVQNYAVCIRVENGYCGIRYSQVSNDIYSFTVSGDTAQNNFMLADTEVKYGDTDCRNDYIIIPGGSDNGVNNEFSRDRHFIENL